MAFQLLNWTETIDLCNHSSAEQYGFRSTAVFLAVVNDFCTCQLDVLWNHWRIIPASPPPNYRMKQHCTFPNKLALQWFQLCIFVQARGRCSHSLAVGTSLRSMSLVIQERQVAVLKPLMWELVWLWSRQLMGTDQRLAISYFLVAVSGVLGSPWVLWWIQKAVRPPSAG